MRDREKTATKTKEKTKRETERQGDGETERQGGREAERQGDRETGRQGHTFVPELQSHSETLHDKFNGEEDLKHKLG